MLVGEFGSLVLCRRVFVNKCIFIPIVWSFPRVDRPTSSQAGGLYRLGVPTVMDQHVGPHPTISFFIHHTWWSNQINENYINNQIVQNSTINYLPVQGYFRAVGMNGG